MDIIDLGNSSIINYSRTTAVRLNELRNFTINCISDMATLECHVNEGFAPALDSLETTYCTFNYPMNQSVREKCELYHRAYNIRKGYSGLNMNTRGCGVWDSI